MNIQKFRNKIYDHPHRCNDADLSTTLDYIEQLQEDYDELDAKYAELLKESTKHSQHVIATMLDLAINRPEIFIKKE